jgi:hypothetical protein
MSTTTDQRSCFVQMGHFLTGPIEGNVRRAVYIGGDVISAFAAQCCSRSAPVNRTDIVQAQVFLRPLETFVERPTCWATSSGSG